MWLTVIVLFAALAFFAFAQAAAARNGAQSAADAAALAAAQEAREELLVGLEESIGQDENWLEWLNGAPLRGAGAQAAADRLAAQNDATVTGFGHVIYGFVEDAPEQGRGRERWWRAVDEGTDFGHEL
ncbi:pilus assembly protein TadG-related protein, partial [Streptomyces sp. NPDC002454]